VAATPARPIEAGGMLVAPDAAEVIGTGARSVKMKSSPSTGPATDY